MTDQKVEQVWQDFWRPIVCKDEESEVDMEQVKRELYDWYIAMNEVSKVYCEITGNMISKPHTKSEVVIEKADEHYKDLYQNMDIDELKEIMGID